MSGSNGAGRALPHSLEAEERLLATCFIDGADVLTRCLEAQLGPASFYDPRHGAVFERMLDLFNRGIQPEVSVVAEELRRTNQLDYIGGFPFLVQVSGIVPTQAQAGFFIDKVRDLARRRDYIKVATGGIEGCYDLAGDIDDILADNEARMQRIGGRAPARSHEMTWPALFAFSPKADADCLMGKRFLSRTGSAVIVAPSGVGKSVLSLQLGGCAALGRPFFGLQMARPLRVLYVQAEDDIGDVAEAAQGFVAEYKLGESDLAALRERFRILRWNDAAGDKFLSRLRGEHAKHPFDLVIVNPLFSFCACNVSDQEQMSGFLRNGLNPILHDTGAACVLVHHTNKPKEDAKAVSSDEDRSYLGSGSAELTNWARGYITLQQVKAAGGKVYKMSFAKRGHRAGIVDADGRPSTSVLIEHSPRGLCWLPSDYSSDKGQDGKFQPKFDLPRARTFYDEELSWKDNEQVIAEDQGLSARAVRAHRRLLEAVR